MKFSSFVPPGFPLARNGKDYDSSDSQVSTERASQIQGSSWDLSFIPGLYDARVKAPHPGPRCGPICWEPLHVPGWREVDPAVAQVTV